MDNVETMAYYGEVPWHGLGNPIGHAMNSEEALRYSELDWEVVSEPVLVRGSALEHYRANVRDKDGAVYGIVSDRYKLVQNRDAFAFTDFLLKNDLGIPVEYETAGALDGGKRVWMLAKLPARAILGDEIIPYIVFTNTHDGKGSVKVAMTPTRVVCQNTLQLAMGTARRTWSTRHIGNLESKLTEARNTLNMAQFYMDEFEKKAELLQQNKISNEQLHHLLELLFPYEEDSSERVKANAEAYKSTLLDIYTSKTDLSKFNGTAWGVYNAIADFESHLEPQRVTKTFKERRFVSFIDGNARMAFAEGYLVA